MQMTGKWGKTEAQEYYESQSQKKVLSVPNLSMLLHLINLQTLKLPHEILDPSTNQPTGSTNEDIEKSICRAVEMAYVNVAHIRKQKGKNYEGGEVSDYKSALQKLEWIYELLDEADYLNDHLITQEMDDPDEYDDNFDAGDMPAPDAGSHDKKVGGLEEEDEEPVVSSPVA